jgi:hypothetical protein
MESSDPSADRASKNSAFSHGDQLRTAALRLNTSENVNCQKKDEGTKHQTRRRYNYTDFYYNATPKMKSIFKNGTEKNAPIATKLTPKSLDHHDKEQIETPADLTTTSQCHEIGEQEAENHNSQHEILSNALVGSNRKAWPISEEEQCNKQKQSHSIDEEQHSMKVMQPKASKKTRTNTCFLREALETRQEQQSSPLEDLDKDSFTATSAKSEQPQSNEKRMTSLSGMLAAAQYIECSSEVDIQPQDAGAFVYESPQFQRELNGSGQYEEEKYERSYFRSTSEERQPKGCPNEEETYEDDDSIADTSLVVQKPQRQIPEINPVFPFMYYQEPRIFATYHSPEERSLTIWKPLQSQETTLTVWQPNENPGIYQESDPASDNGAVFRFGDEDSYMKSSSQDSIGKGSSHGSTCSMSDLESQDDDQSYRAPGGNDLLIHIYFKSWSIATVILLLINCANMNWVYLFKNESWWMICLSLIFFGIQGILQWSVLELPLMSLASALVKSETDRATDGSHLTILINYNLLASYKSEVDATLVNAFSAYIGNLGPTVASVLVSATGDEELKEYELLVRDNLREQIFELVVSEGKAWASGKVHDEGRARRVFEPFRDPRTGLIDENFVQLILPSLAIKYAKDFMVIQRVTRVLRKCGQYQDLMLLSEGDNSAWTYTDKDYYKEAAREFGEPLFQIAEDVENIQGRRFDYTLVLDSDTGVVKNSIETLLSVAAANPERAILQPAIKIVAKDDQSLFMHIDKMRQETNEPITAALTTLLGRSGFYGKGLIQNKYYIKALLGTRENPIEKVPIDVLSHDTFEAGALSPLYVSCVQLLEEPCGNYVTWDIRECRWNRGELLLAHYFFPRSLGRLFEWMMCRVRKTPPTKLILRHETQLDDAGAYIAHSALRQMMLKPLLLMYIVCRVWVKVYFFFNWLPLVLMVVLVLIIPKIPLANRRNWHKILADILCCVLQYSPEPITGTIRVFKSARAHICGVSGWVPQFKVEQDFLILPAVVATFAYQWRLFLLTCASLTPIIIFRPEDYLLIFLFAVTAFIPIYTTLTALPYSSWKRSFRRIQFYLCCKCIPKNRERRKQKMLIWQRKSSREPSLPKYHSRSDDRSRSSHSSTISRSNRDERIVDRSYSDSYDDRSYASRSSSWSNSIVLRNEPKS